MFRSKKTLRRAKVFGVLSAVAILLSFSFQQRSEAFFIHAGLQAGLVGQGALDAGFGAGAFAAPLMYPHLLQAGGVNSMLLGYQAPYLDPWSGHDPLMVDPFMHDPYLGVHTMHHPPALGLHAGLYGAGSLYGAMGSTGWSTWANHNYYSNLYAQGVGGLHGNIGIDAYANAGLNIAGFPITLGQILPYAMMGGNALGYAGAQLGLGLYSHIMSLPTSPYIAGNWRLPLPPGCMYIGLSTQQMCGGAMGAGAYGGLSGGFVGGAALDLGVTIGL